MITRFFLPLFAALFTLILASQIHAQSREEHRALQHALSQYGFYNGPIDGLGGPMTRKAIAGYAHDYGVENNWHAVAAKLFNNVHWEVEWTDTVEKVIMETLETHLLDARSARIRKRVLYRTDGGTSACLHINAKNALGAYTGYEWLYFTVTEVGDLTASLREMVSTLDPTAEVSEPMGFAWVVGPYSYSAHVSETLCWLGYIMERENR